MPCILLAPNYLITLPNAWNKKLRMGLINQGSMLQLPHQMTTPYSPMILLLHCTVLNSFLQQTEQQSSFISTASFKSQKIPMLGAHLHDNRAAHKCKNGNSPRWLVTARCPILPLRNRLAARPIILWNSHTKCW